MKRIVLTGPTGVIGMALIHLCIQKNIEVFAICRENSSHISRIPKHPLVHVLECSLNRLGVYDISKIPKCDIFYHLAWEATIGADRNNTYLQLQNISYTLDAVELAATLGCDTFVGAGSQAEYGKYEGDLSGNTPAFPETGYGIAKLCAGQMSRIECEKRGIKHIWCRILSVYGPYGNEKTMIISVIRQLLKKEKPLLTKGEQVWDYLYSSDAASALYLLGCHGINNKIYCVGSGNARPLKEYLYMIKGETHSAAPLGIGEVPYSDGQVMYLCADIGDLRRDTGFMPKIGFREGIRQTIEWVRKNENVDGYGILQK